MPIYEFYCPDCNTLFNFLSKSVNTEKRPDCPKCGRKKIERQVSVFASTGNAKEPGEPGDLPFDESRMEGAIESLAAEAESIDEDNPRDAAKLIRKFSHMTGMELGDHMQEAISRMEAGEDPEAIEADMGDVLEDKDPFQTAGQGGTGSTRSRPPPSRDETLYELR